MNTTTAYPIGKFKFPEQVTPHQRAKAIVVIEQLPAQLGELVASFKDGDLNKTYREGGWNVRQIVHHVADSHMNEAVMQYEWHCRHHLEHIKIALKN